MAGFLVFQLAAEEQLCAPVAILGGVKRASQLFAPDARFVS
jgi:hypothetical protein